MFNKILIYALISVFMFFGSIVVIQHFKIAKLEVNVIEKNNAIQAYEELLKVIPFNRMVEERIENVEDEINATLSDDNSIADGSYKL